MTVASLDTLRVRAAAALERAGASPQMATATARALVLAEALGHREFVLTRLYESA